MLLKGEIMIREQHYILFLRVIGIFWITVGIGPLNAENRNPGSAHILSVEDVVSEAMRENPDLMIAEATIAAARGERRTAGQWKNPEITAEYGEKRVSDREGDLTAKGNAQRYSFNQLFEFPGKASLRKAIAEKNIQLAELALAQLRLEVAAKTRSLAIEWLVATRIVKTVDEVADRSRSLVEMLTKRTPAGVQLLLDQRVIEGSMVTIKIQAREAAERQNNAQMALNILRGKPSQESLSIRTDLNPPSLHVARDALLQKASTANVVLKSSAVEIERADQSLSQARLGAAPDFTIGPFFSQENTPERERILGVGVSLPLPLWDWNRGQIDVAKADLNRAQARHTQAIRTAESNLIQEYTTYQLILKQLEETPLEFIRRFHDAADLADRQYRLGAISAQTYLGMQQQYLELTEGILNTIREAHERLYKIQVATSDPKLFGQKEAAQ
jgi:outer membrane protein, heavy metal efflux system